MKNKNHMIITKDSENFDKTQYPFMIKLSTMWVLLRINRECNNIIKTIYNKLTVNIILNGEKLKRFSSKIRVRTEMLTLTTFIQHFIGSPNQGN